MNKNAWKHFGRKKVRLYGKIDADLIALYRNPKFSLPKAIVLALQMCARGQVKYIRLPEPRILKDIPKRIEFAISIPEDDMTTLEWLHSIPSGKRNDAIKNIVRGYMCGPVVSCYTGAAGKDNVAGFNSGEKAMIDCLKSEGDVERASREELRQIQQILEQDGVSPESLLSLLRKGKQAQKQAALAALEGEGAGDGSSGEEEKAEAAPEEPTVEGMEVESEPDSETIDSEDDSGFDLFGAMSRMMEDM